MVSYGVQDPNALQCEIELFINCEKLKDLDTFSKSDP